MSQPYTCAPSSSRYSTGIGAGACVQYERQRVRVERPGLVERAGRAGVDAEAALAAIELEGRRRLELDVRDERAEHDP